MNTMKKKEAPKSQKENEGPTKQLKVFLSTQEHAVVSTAARMQGKQIGQYMKDAIIQKAKIDAKAFNNLIDNI